MEYMFEPFFRKLRFDRRVGILSEDTQIVSGNPKDWITHCSGHSAPRLSDSMFTIQVIAHAAGQPSQYWDRHDLNKGLKHSYYWKRHWWFYKLII